jgi:hypothetical protein
MTKQCAQRRSGRMGRKIVLLLTALPLLTASRERPWSMNWKKIRSPKVRIFTAKRNWTSPEEVESF